MYWRLFPTSMGISISNFVKFREKIIEGFTFGIHLGRSVLGIFKSCNNKEYTKRDFTTKRKE